MQGIIKRPKKSNQLDNRVAYFFQFFAGDVPSALRFLNSVKREATGGAPLSKQEVNTFINLLTHVFVHVDEPKIVAASKETIDIVLKHAQLTNKQRKNLLALKGSLAERM